MFVETSGFTRRATFVPSILKHEKHEKQQFCLSLETGERTHQAVTDCKF
jgi:hypothetical protein